MHSAVVVRTAKDIRRPDGSVIRFDNNAAVARQQARKSRSAPVSSARFVRELRATNHMKIISLAPEVL